MALKQLLINTSNKRATRINKDTGLNSGGASDLITPRFYATTEETRWFDRCDNIISYDIASPEFDTHSKQYAKYVKLVEGDNYK